MEDIKNKNSEVTEVIQSEEIMEVALADSAEENSEPAAMEYTEAEMSGLTEQQRRRKEIFDKITTGILIALLCSPIAIVLYIFLWFITRG